MDEPRWLTFDLFEGRVGERFVMSADGRPPVELWLAEARESDAPGGPAPDGSQRLQFSLVFHGPAEPMLPQGTYGLDHDGLGHLDLFMVPLGPDPDGLRYEAAFA